MSAWTGEAEDPVLRHAYDTDIRALLPAIRARTAVLHREADQGPRFELGREVAALIPGRR